MGGGCVADENIIFPKTYVSREYNYTAKGPNFHVVNNKNQKFSSTKYKYPQNHIY